MTTDSTPRTVDAVKTTCCILDALQEMNGAGVTELANHLDFSKATIHSHLATLYEKEYVVKDANQYALSLKYLDVAQHVRDRVGIYDAVEDELNDLAEETGELAQFATHEHGRAVYLYKAEGENAVQTASRIGRREYLHCISLGKAMLAHMSDEDVQRIVDRHGLPEMTNNTITNEETLFEELAKIRERGHAFDEEEKISGLRCIAAPVEDTNGRIYGAVSVSGPSSRMVGDKFRNDLPDQVKRSVNVIEINAKFA